MSVPPDTVLVIAGVGFPPFSARGVTQTYAVIDAAKNFERTVNAKLVSLSPDGFKKYSCSCSCSDVDPVAIDGIFPGDEVVVDWVREFAYLTDGGSPSREVVPGSARIEGDFTFYRPRMTMLVRDHSGSSAEWEASEPWQIDLEEI